MDRELNWRALGNNRCPKCNAPLTWGLVDYTCSKNCGFKISDRKFRQIQISQNRYDIERRRSSPALTDEEAMREGTLLKPRGDET